MRTILLLFVLSLCGTRTATAQGIMILNGIEGALMPMGAIEFKVDVTDQVAMVTVTQEFLNNTSDTLYPKYAYPLPEQASATRLRWLRNDSMWHQASMVAQAQDTTLPGMADTSVADLDLQEYVGTTPLYFRMLEGIAPNTSITMEITYVELLLYSSARVEMLLTKDMSAVIDTTIPQIALELIVRSQRELTGADITGMGSWQPLLSLDMLQADSLHASVNAVDVPANCSSVFGYDLDPMAYGLISLSNYLPDPLVKCDELGNGFFVLLIEPEPTSVVVPKSFVIIIDKSGSMQGSKILEARDAAQFMVGNMNPGDQFNVIAFDDGHVSWNTGLQPFNAGNMSSALDWIAQINAMGGTNINGALLAGISNYGTQVSANTARTIMFLTDGEDPNPQILSNVQAGRLATDPELQLFTFGVGAGYNEQLLNQLAVQNNGISQFLEGANFSQVMSDFYTQIQSPVLLSPIATFNRPDVQEIFPDPLIGLYVGQQMVLVGRYDEPGPVQLQLNGFAQGQPVVLDYTFDLTSEFDEERLFVTKVWAQKAIASLMNEYYSYALGSQEAIMIEDSVTSYSMCYGVGSPFTSFADPGEGGGAIVEVEEEGSADSRNTVVVFPDPFVAGSNITFDLSSFTAGEQLFIRIYDPQGRMIYEKDLAQFAGRTWLWDGSDMNGMAVSGQLFFTISGMHDVLSGRITRI